MKTVNLPRNPGKNDTFLLAGHARLQAMVVEISRTYPYHSQAPVIVWAKSCRPALYQKAIGNLNDIERALTEKDLLAYLEFLDLYVETVKKMYGEYASVYGEKEGRK